MSGKTETAVCAAVSTLSPKLQGGIHRVYTPPVASVNHHDPENTKTTVIGGGLNPAAEAHKGHDFTPTPQPPPSHIIASMPNPNISITRNAECVTRDGTILRADVYHDPDLPPQPVLVCRTPYNKLLPRYQETATAIAEAGYTTVVQDMRGRYASDGDYIWMWRDKHESFDVQDGYDTIEWAANLPQSDGRVGTWGHSNASWAIWMTLHASPPSLAAALASGISMNMLDCTFGVWETGRRLEWTYMMAADVRRREGRDDGPTDPAEATFRWNAVERSKYIWWLPLEDIPEHVFAGLTDQYQTFLRNTNHDYMRFDEAHPKVEVPVMQITGWWDRLIGTIDNYEGLINNGNSDLREQHRLIVGPWGHDATNYAGDIGPIDYGPEANTTYADLIVRWYDYALKNKDNGTAEEKPVQLYILNRNEWIGADAWPLPETQYTNLYLHSNGNANTVNGDGKLSFDIPSPLMEEHQGEAAQLPSLGDGETAQPLSPSERGASEASGVCPSAEGALPSPAGRERARVRAQSDGASSDHFTYDPCDPVMSLMHQNSQSIPMDQSPNDHRQDVLVYETEPMTEDLDVIGPVHLKLWASTDAPETDFTAKLAIVHEDGLCVNLTYGIIRTTYREGYHQTAYNEPNTPYEYEIKLNPVGCRFQKGQRIRLYIASSDFPNFDRNHNTGKPYYSDTELRTAHQTIHHSSEMPSRLILPIIPKPSPSLARGTRERSDRRG